jgi:3-dehydrosphinganine reductase
MPVQNPPWSGKNALVTGGSSGIGLATAGLLVKQGANVWLLADHQEKLGDALSRLDCSPEQYCGLIRADVSNFEEVQSAIEQVIEQTGIPDLVVNSAGVTYPGYFHEIDLDIFREMMEVNYFGTVYVTKIVLPGMLTRGSGHIINIASMAGIVGVFGYTAYGASKYAVRGFTDALRSEIKPLGIRLSIVFPVDTDTPQLHYENQFKPYETKVIASSVRVMSPESVAETILRDAAKGRYVILPGLESKVLYWAIGLAGNGVYPIIDWLIKRAQKKMREKE